MSKNRHCGRSANFNSYLIEEISSSRLLKGAQGLSYLYLEQARWPSGKFYQLHSCTRRAFAQRRSGHGPDIGGGIRHCTNSVPAAPETSSA